MAGKSYIPHGCDQQGRLRAGAFYGSTEQREFADTHPLDEQQSLPPMTDDDRITLAAVVWVSFIAVVGGAIWAALS